jgi:hypothetical protein
MVEDSKRDLVLPFHLPIGGLNFCQYLLPARHVGAVIGFLAVLHTWGQNLLAVNF